VVKEQMDYGQPHTRNVSCISPNEWRVKMSERHQALATVAEKMGLGTQQVIQAVKLFDEGCTLPFIARYRKEATNNLDETQLSGIQKQIASIDALIAARAKVVSALKSQGLLTPSLQAAIFKATSITSIEDIFAPYKPKRSTRASAARDNGLLPLAIALLSPSSSSSFSSSVPSPKALAQRYINPPTFPTADSALSGARDIIAEWASEMLKGREKARSDLRRYALLTVKLSRSSSSSSKKNKDRNNDTKPVKSKKSNNSSSTNPDTYKDYHAFRAHVKAVKPHQILAINRGERAGVLSVGFDWNLDPVAAFCRHILVTEPPPSSVANNNKNNSTIKTQSREHSSLRGDYMAQIRLAVDDGVKRLLAPAMERELRSELTKTAAEAAVASFSSNLYALLMQPPLLPAVTVMGVDPAYKTGCKLAVCDGQTSKVVYTGVIYPNPPATEIQRMEAGMVLKQAMVQYGVRAVAIGNGTASRETQHFVSQCIASLNNQGSAFFSKEKNRDRITTTNNSNNRVSVGWCVVDEAGASVYSASELARTELPNLDVTLRGAVSIARRLQDPLSELVKVQPSSLGVGLYQHDLKEAQLESELDTVVEIVVNRVGVNLNTASTALLQRVAGLNKKTAAAMVRFREECGGFRRREELRKVKGVGPVAFQQCAGFLRIIPSRDDGGVKGNVLDGTNIHPESYIATEKLVQLLIKNDDHREEDESKKKKHKVDKKGGRGDILLVDIQAIKNKLESLKQQQQQQQQQQDKHSLAEELGIGLPTLQDIIQALIDLCDVTGSRGGGEDADDDYRGTYQRDVRGRAKLDDLQFGQGMELKDLKQGMELNGIVRNVVEFGCFVDCNCGVDGLIHKSMMKRGGGGASKVGEKRGRDQWGSSSGGGGVQLKIGDTIRVKVLSIDVGRGRLSLQPA
jgi:protein Tex